jgi:hypothetical protein
MNRIICLFALLSFLLVSCSENKTTAPDTEPSIEVSSSSSLAASENERIMGRDTSYLIKTNAYQLDSVGESELHLSYSYLQCKENQLISIVSPWSNEYSLSNGVLDTDEWGAWTLAGAESVFGLWTPTAREPGNSEALSLEIRQDSVVHKLKYKYCFSAALEERIRYDREDYRETSYPEAYSLASDGCSIAYHISGNDTVTYKLNKVYLDDDENQIGASTALSYQGKTCEIDLPNIVELLDVATIPHVCEDGRSLSEYREEKEKAFYADAKACVANLGIPSELEAPAVYWAFE